MKKRYDTTPYLVRPLKKVRAHLVGNYHKCSIKDNAPQWVLDGFEKGWISDDGGIIVHVNNERWKCYDHKDVREGDYITLDQDGIYDVLTDEEVYKDWQHSEYLTQLSESEEK